MILNKLYCEYFYITYNKKCYASYIIFSNFEIITMDAKTFNIKENSDADIKILNRILLKLAENYSNEIGNTEILIVVTSEEVYNRLILNLEYGSLEEDICKLYKNIQDTLASKNIILEKDNGISSNIGLTCDKYLSENHNLYKLFLRLNLLIRKYQAIIEDKHKLLSSKDIAVQDILHFLELRELNEIKKLEFADMLIKLRRDRREVKDNLVIADSFYQAFTKVITNINSNFFKTIKSSVTVEEIKNYKSMFSTKMTREALLKSI